MNNAAENERLAAVHRFMQLDFNKTNEFQHIVNLIAEVCDKPLALITLLDEDLNWIKVKTGLDIAVMPRETSFCQYGIRQDELLIIPDANNDVRFVDNPLVLEAPGVRFYAGAPLVIKGGLRLGTLCLFDVKPSTLTPIQQKILMVLSKQVTFLMELELSHQLLQEHVKHIEAQNESLSQIARIQSHDIRQPLTSIMGLINCIRDDDYVTDKEQLMMIEEAAHALDKKIHAVMDLTGLNGVTASALAAGKNVA